MNLIILGASGSIGTQTLEILPNYKNKWTLAGFSVGNKAFLVHKIIEKFPTIKHICVKNYSDYKDLKKKYPTIKFYYGDKGLIKLINKNKDAAILNALVGFVGLKPSIVTLKNRQKLLLANKESLVVGGEILKKLERKYNNPIIPIDSEHVAIKKCLYNEDLNSVKKITITASGGPFFFKTKEELKNVTLSDALNHPNWSMGQKITIDSATLMNKTFELIEGYYLFDVPFNKIDAIVERTSHVHGFIEFFDGKNKANISSPSMIPPIIYALNLGKPEKENFDDIFINNLDAIEFFPLDLERFPLLKHAKICVEKKGNYGAILNAVNEECVRLFLDNKISFIEIEKNINIIMKDAKIIRSISYYRLKKTHQRYVKKVQKLLEVE